MATTKAYSTQLAVVAQLALYLADARGTISAERYAALVAELEQLPEKVAKVLEDQNEIQYFASQFFNHASLFFLGRNLD